MNEMNDKRTIATGLCMHVNNIDHIDDAYNGMCVCVCVSQCASWMCMFVLIDFIPFNTTFCVVHQ